MDNVIQIVNLLQAELEVQILNGHGTAVVTERDLETIRRRIAAHPQALSAVTYAWDALNWRVQTEATYVDNI